MNKIARMTPMIPRGAVIGKQTGGPLLNDVLILSKNVRAAAASESLSLFSTRL
jgi:hypothetical protein